MQKIFNVIMDCGDGSQCTLWFRDPFLTEKILRALGEADRINAFASGDGVQIIEILVPDTWNLDEMQGVSWSDWTPFSIQSWNDIDDGEPEISSWSEAIAYISK